MTESKVWMYYLANAMAMEQMTIEFQLLYFFNW